MCQNLCQNPTSCAYSTRSLSNLGAQMLTQNNDHKLLSFFKDPSTAALTTMNPTTVTTTTVSTGSTEGIYNKYSLIEKYLEGRNWTIALLLRSMRST